MVKRCDQCKYARKPVLKGKGYVGCMAASRNEDLEEKIIASDKKIGDHYMYWGCKMNQNKKGVMKVGVCVNPESSCLMWEELK